MALFIILIFILKFMNKEPYDYTCHNCSKRFRKKDLLDLRGSWHLKDWTLSSLQISKYNSNNQLNDKLICIKDEDDPKLIDLLSDGWKIIQISAAGIYCWVLLRKPLNL